MLLSSTRSAAGYAELRWISSHTLESVAGHLLPESFEELATHTSDGARKNYMHFSSKDWVSFNVEAFGDFDVEINIFPT